MTRSAVFVACVGAFCLGITLNASAEPVTITGGSLVFPSGEFLQIGPISLTGTRGFSLQGFVDAGELSIPGLGFGFPPGSTLEPGIIVGSAFFATTLTLDGRTFPNVGSGLTSLRLDLFTPMIVPPLQASPVTVTAPFSFTGSFRGDPDLPPLEASFQGSGRVSVIFSEEPGGSCFSGGIRLRLRPQATPEPATLVLISGGLVATAARVRRRRAPTE